MDVTFFENQSYFSKKKKQISSWENMCEDIFWETNPSSLKSNMELWEYFLDISPNYSSSTTSN